MDIVLDCVTKSFGGEAVLNSVSAVFPLGQVSAVIAPSGRGKTTLMRLILGLDSADSGTISGVPDKKAALFQEDRLFPRLTAEANIRAVLGKDASDSQIRELLKALGLKGAEGKTADQLSGGMSRRVALARALLANAELIVLDEPFKGLDEQNRQLVAEAVASYTAGKTVLLVTHSDSEAALLNASTLFRL